MKLIHKKNLKINFLNRSNSTATVITPKKKIKHEIYSFGYLPDIQDSDDEPSPSREALEPKVVPGYEGFPIKMISSNWQHSMFVSEDNKVFGWGNNDFGQLGIPFIKKVSSFLIYLFCFNTLNYFKATTFYFIYVNLFTSFLFIFNSTKSLILCN